MVNLKRLLKLSEAYIDYFIPREVLGPVLLVFSAENVVNELFLIYVPESYSLEAWGVIMIVVAIIISVWGNYDEDKEELDEEVTEVINST